MERPVVERARDLEEPLLAERHLLHVRRHLDEPARGAIRVRVGDHPRARVVALEDGLEPVVRRHALTDEDGAREQVREDPRELGRLRLLGLDRAANGRGRVASEDAESSVVGDGAEDVIGVDGDHV